MGRLNSNTGLIRDSIVLHKEDESYERSEKNWLPFRWNSKLFVVTSGYPLIVREVQYTSPRTGDCSFLREASVKAPIVHSAAGGYFACAIGCRYICHFASLLPTLHLWKNIYASPYDI